MKARAHLKMPHRVIVRSPGLLPMMYRTRELARELGVSRGKVVNWTQNGAPHQRDRRGHIWINGRLFASWVESHRRPRSRPQMPRGKGYCLRCNEIVTIKDPESQQVGNMIMLSGSCPDCGAQVNRASSDD